MVTGRRPGKLVERPLSDPLTDRIHNPEETFPGRIAGMSEGAALTQAGSAGNDTNRSEPAATGSAGTNTNPTFPAT